jgi:hypothetical protein
VIINYNGNPPPAYGRRLYDAGLGGFVPDWFCADDESGRYGVYLRHPIHGTYYIDPKTDRAAIAWRRGQVKLFAPTTGGE